MIVPVRRNRRRFRTRPPVVVGVNGLNLPAFLQFADGLAGELAPDVGEIVDWCLATLAEADVRCLPLRSRRSTRNSTVGGFGSDALDGAAD